MSLLFTFGLLVPVPAALAFEVNVSLDVTVNRISKPDGTALQAGEFTARVGYFAFDPNFQTNNAAVIANKSNPATLEANFRTLFTFDAVEQAEGDTGVSGEVQGEVGAKAGGAGRLYAYILLPDTTYSASFPDFAGKNIYVWIQLNSNPAVQAIFTSQTSKFPPSNDPFNAGGVLSVNEAIEGLRVLAGIDRTALASNDYQLEAAFTTASLQFENAIATVPETAGSVALRVVRSGKTDSAVTVNFTTSDGTASAGLDYTATGGTLTFAAGDTDETITVPVASRPGFQGDRTFNVTLSQPGAGAELGGQITAAVTIQESEQPMAGVISFTQAAAIVSEAGGTVQLTVQRTGGSDGPVSVAVDTANGSASAGQDYTPITNGTIEFIGGDAAPKTINIPIINDNAFEGDETFMVVLSNPTGGAILGAASTATVTIDEDDAAPVQGAFRFGAATYSVAEGAGAATITVERVNGEGGEVSVQYATGDGSATAGVDYGSATGTLTWASGDTVPKSFQVAIIPNSLDQPDRQFTVTLSNPTGGAALAAPSIATVTILNDDMAGVLSFESATASVPEDGGLIPLTITRTGGSDGSVAVTVNTGGGTAVAGKHYTGLSNQVVNFAEGQTSTTLNIAIIDNPNFANNRTFDVTLSNPTGGAILGTIPTTTVTIVENETAQAGRIQFAVAKYLASEAVGSRKIRITRSGGSDTEVTVKFRTSAGTASPGSDYTATMETVTFAVGETSKKVTVPIVNDGVFEPSEFLNLVLKKPTNGATLGARSTARLRIIDDDLAMAFHVEPDEITTSEGATVTVRVLRENGTEAPAEIGYTTRRFSATAQDYTPTRGILSFAAGETEKTVTVKTLEDKLAEGVENFELRIFLLEPADPGKRIEGTGATLIILGRSDFIDQPDLMASNGANASFAGDDLYNASGDGQIALQIARPGETHNFVVRIQNDSDVTDSFEITAAAAGTALGSEVVIYRNGGDISEEIATEGVSVKDLAPGAFHDFEVQVIVDRGADPSTGYGAKFTVTSVGTPAKQDAARVGVLVVD